MRFRLLLVDDHALCLELTQRFLSEAGFEVDTATNAVDALRMAERNSESYSLYILDYLLGTDSGAELAQRIRVIDPDAYVVMYSNDQSRDALKDVMRVGANDYIDKSAPPAEFLATVRRWCSRYLENRKLAPQTSPSATRELIASIGLVGQSLAMARVAEAVERYRNNDSNVLILGETGTGKEQIARSLHGDSDRPYLAVNCASFTGSADLMEAELFGVERGAFTGATHSRKGILEDVCGGTLFLDEIHTLSLSAQQKLLRAIEQRKVRRVGTTREYDVHFRLITAAKPEITSMAEDGSFLLDLFHRLHVLEIHVPPLQERPEDIGPLAEHFFQMFRSPGRPPKRLLIKTLDILQRYPWPGNVRELMHVIERLAVNVPGDTVLPADLEARFLSRSEAKVAQRGAARKLSRETVELTVRSSRSMREAARRLGVPHSTLHDLVKEMRITALPRTGRAG